MLKLFRNNMALQSLLIMAALLLLWLRPLITPPAMVAAPTDGILYTLLLPLFANAPRAAVIIAMLLVLVEGVMLNILLSDTGLVPQTTLLPTLLYIVFLSAPATTLTPMIFVSAALIACTWQLSLKGTLLTISTTRICSATAIIGLCSLFYLPALAIIISYLLVAISYRLYNWRDITTMLLGLLAPYLFLATVLYLTGGLAEWWSATAASLGDITMHIAPTAWLPLTANIVLALLFAVSLFALWLRIGEHPVMWQKNASTVMLVSVGGIVMLLYSRLLPVDLAFFAIPFALCGTHMLMPTLCRPSATRSRKQHLWVYDMLLVLIITAAILC